MNSPLNQTFTEELIPTFICFHEIQRDGKLTHSMQPVLYLSQNQTRTHPKKRTTGQST
jgi:hypothetical protein